MRDVVVELGPVTRAGAVGESPQFFELTRERRPDGMLEQRVGRVGDP